VVDVSELGVQTIGVLTGNLGQVSEQSTFIYLLPFGINDSDAVACRAQFGLPVAGDDSGLHESWGRNDEGKFEDGIQDF